MMRSVLSGVQMDGVVVIGEGEKDEVRRGEEQSHWFVCRGGGGGGGPPPPCPAPPK